MAEPISREDPVEVDSWVVLMVITDEKRLYTLFWPLQISEIWESSLLTASFFAAAPLIAYTHWSLLSFISSSHWNCLIIKLKGNLY